MVKSMTGYGRCREVVDGRDILVEVKSVNSRYIDANIKTGRLYNALEEKLKSLASTYISRGKVDIYLTVENLAGEMGYGSRRIGNVELDHWNAGVC